MPDVAKPDTSGHPSIGASAGLDLDLKTYIRSIPDWPVPGVQFQDITPLLQSPQAFRRVVDALVRRYNGVDGEPALRPDVIAGLDARGFILGAVVAYALGVGFVPIRKQGKLPFTTVQESYALEYGCASVELHLDAVQQGDRVLLMDDLIATGGTMLAGKKLLEQLGAHFHSCLPHERGFALKDERANLKVDD